MIIIGYLFLFKSDLCFITNTYPKEGNLANNIFQGIQSPSEAAVSALPNIRREQITLTKFLGSGAFGEVFEGIARNLQDQEDTTKVAVKVKNYLILMYSRIYIASLNLAYT